MVARGALLHLDVKELPRFREPGHRATGDRRELPRNRGVGYEYLRCFVNDHSRYAYVELHPHEDGLTAARVLERARRGSVGGTCDGASEPVGNHPDSNRTTHVLIDGVTPPDNVVIENNWFDDPSGNSIMFRSDTGQVLTNHTLRYNAFLSALFAEGPGTWTNFNVVGNISPMNPWGCDAGLNYSHNVFSNTLCGATDKQAAPGFVNAGAFDLHLATGSAAVNAGDPAQYPGKDIDGQSRPMGSAPDAGVDEAG